VHVGGNIGSPLIDRLRTIGAEEPIVLELSSFQLELFDPEIAYGPFDAVGPDIAAVLNITPNHLDRHGTMAVYGAAKLNLLRNLPPEAIVVLNADDAVTAQLIESASSGRSSESMDEVNGAKFVADVTSNVTVAEKWGLNELLTNVGQELIARNARLIPFSCRIDHPAGASCQGDKLVSEQEAICSRGEVKLRGDHNVSNLLAAAAISRAAGASIDGIRRVATSFSGVSHRLEVVSVSNGVTWVNDSIATSPERAVAALRSFDSERSTLILLAGGKDKDLPWTAFADETIARVTMLVGFGDAGPMIVNAVQERAEATKRKAPSCGLVQRLDEAVDLAARVAQPNSIVLLSPGGTSYDAYQDFEERGEHFRQLVRDRNQRSVENRVAKRSSPSRPPSARPSSSRSQSSFLPESSW
jgi:UDP-N-acetylmuramoylalanine--D-glutamate ligase